MRPILSIALIALIAVLFSVPAYSQTESAYDMAVKAYRNKDFKAVVSILKEYVAAKPDPKAYYLMGYAVYKLNRNKEEALKESAEYFKEAYLIDPEFNPDTVKADIRGEAKAQLKQAEPVQKQAEPAPAQAEPAR